MLDPAAVLQALYAADGEKYFDDAPAVPMFDPPLVGVAAADDPWFTRIAQHVGPPYWTPAEALATAEPGAKARSVICWALPVAERARQANRGQTRTPSRPWIYVRMFGQLVIDRMERALVTCLRQAGWAAAAPTQLPESGPTHRPGVGWAARWSHRHAAFVAGLGTFGISGGLITARGIAHRLGSVVTAAELTPTPRPYGDDPFAWCLKTARGTCGACIGRCPAGSIGETHAQRDKDACKAHLDNVVNPWAAETLHWQGAYGCGLCQTGVPCESANPVQKA
jgi:epoxyqueuosine reductase